MVYIQLSNGLYTVVDPEMLPIVSGYNWHGHVDRTTGRLYVHRWDKHTDRYKSLHTCVMEAQGPTPRGVTADHRSRDTLDNRLVNLRWATPSQQCQNRGKRKDAVHSQFKGVNYVRTGQRKKRWRAAISVNQKRVSLGVFVSEREAAYAYNEAALKHFGEFARLNQVFA